jgi:Galactose oxidase, central domain
MFGGSDDTNEFNDFWSFDVANNAWTPIESMNGPSPRAGCKMVFDPVGNQLFIIGRKSLRGNESLKVRLILPLRPFFRLTNEFLNFSERLLPV